VSSIFACTAFLLIPYYGRDYVDYVSYFYLLLILNYATIGLQAGELDYPVKAK
jgi:hypothetical protein